MIDYGLKISLEKRRVMNRVVLYRFIAVMLLVIPGIAATYGFLLMKDALFDLFSQFGDEARKSLDFKWLMFLLGLLLFSLGVAFIGGWTFFRDRKRNYLAPRFKEKKQQKK
jgi:hypothetical protein